MCTDPVLLCLDEPAAGLNPNESAELGRYLDAIRDEHATSILLIEHDMSVVMEISDHIVVLDHGAEDRRRHAGGDSQRSQGDRRLSRRRGGRGRGRRDRDAVDERRPRARSVMQALLRCSLLALVAGGASSACARAQTYPTRPVTFVVPFAPGGGTEFLARLLGQRLEQRLGKPFVIENRPGGGGVTGRGLRRPRGTRRLHHPHGAVSGHGDQRRLAQEASLRSRRRLRAARACCRHPLRARGHAVAAGAIGRRPRRARQGQARPARLSLRPGSARPIISLPSCSRA